MNRPYKYLFVGAARTTAALTNRFVGATDNTSRLYKSICKGGLGTAPCKYMICRDGMVGTAGQATSINHRQPSLRMLIVVARPCQDQAGFGTVHPEAAVLPAALGPDPLGRRHLRVHCHQGPCHPRHRQLVRAPQLGPPQRQGCASYRPLLPADRLRVTVFRLATASIE